MAKTKMLQEIQRLVDANQSRGKDLYDAVEALNWVSEDDDPTWEEYQQRVQTAQTERGDVDVVLGNIEERVTALEKHLAKKSIAAFFHKRAYRRCGEALKEAKGKVDSVKRWLRDADAYLNAAAKLTERDFRAE